MMEVVIMAMMKIIMKSQIMLARASKTHEDNTCLIAQEIVSS